MLSDARLHRLMVALLGIQVEVNAPLHTRLWDDDQHVPVEHLRGTKLLAPTIVGQSGPPTMSNSQRAETSPNPPRKPRPSFGSPRPNPMSGSPTVSSLRRSFTGVWGAVLRRFSTSRGSRLSWKNWRFHAPPACSGLT